VLAARGEYQEAATLLEQCLPLLEGRQSFEAAKIKALLGSCLRSLGDTVRGDQMVEEAKTLFTTMDAKAELADLKQRTAIPV
jgi:hypothetical protein